MRARRGSLHTPTSPSLPTFASGHGSTKPYLTAPRSWLRWPALRALRRRRLYHLLKILLPVALLGLVLFLWTFEPHIEIQLHRRRFIVSQIHHIEPLAGCFDPARVSARYNLTRHLHSPKSVELHPGTPLRTSHDCYAFAASVPTSLPPSSPYHEGADDVVYYHTYWRTDLAPFAARQEHFLRSFLATQRPAARLILWSNGDLAQVSPLIRSYVAQFPERVETRVANARELARETALEGSPLLKSTDARAWVDGDLVRLLVVWALGGVWVDMDTLLTRDLGPLLEHEFVTQWDCYNKPYSPFNGALLHFHAHSPYLCEAFHIMANSPPPRASSTDWGSLLYLKLYRRLLAAASPAAPPFKVLPWCFTEGRSCRLDNRLPDPFAGDDQAWRWFDRLSSPSSSSSKSSKSMKDEAEFGVGGRGWWPFGDNGKILEGGRLDTALGRVFGVHLHNQWEKVFPKDGWVERLLLKRYEEKLGVGRERT
ncbi:hypothetical protein PUNSTDRAFT_126451 [Punctularia strigosozonata HHB-11173 SS5]|uniref:uncharacterized protein n=1 Tax=Punctularia strigosozonata (strain HHB-11173) TaxID=741275 RepID=UPI0004418220|nr:uncharacterized protein PUNSTDRAFT_126451 [Punctularia strigosozonata HHB-11173 SS5]EIN08383.1 hypothetical protein PUNSTDRAFT_126451 [Punctularia strigosozonata HHB-11173 SS5]